MLCDMSNAYSTQNLIQILAREREACMRGERLHLNAQLSGNPLIDKFVAVEGVQNFTAYKEFQSTIHRYQREYGVSGLIWQTITVRGQTLHYPAIHDQLIAVSADLEQLEQAKPQVLDFWNKVTLGMDVFISDSRDYRLVTRDDVTEIASRTQWATICKWENAAFLEVLLQLGWGQPTEASYQRSLPHSGSRSIHAVNPGDRPIG